MTGGRIEKNWLSRRQRHIISTSTNVTISMKKEEMDFYEKSGKSPRASIVSGGYPKRTCHV
jgi:hypothetical protein